MILTTCAACAAPLAHDAPRCVRCKIRYCDSTCQHDLTMNARVKADISYLRERERYLIEAETILEDVLRRFRRVFGESHPGTRVTEDTLVFARHLKARVVAAAEELESRES